MSTEQNDQHLSDAVDGQLPPDLLRSLCRDAEIASRLETLRRDARAVRQLGEQTRRQLEISAPAAGQGRASIAATVLSEAIRRAEEQQLDASHPLMLASALIGSQPVRPRDRRMSLARWSAVAALAASVAVWFTLVPPGVTEVAQQLPDPAGSTANASLEPTGGLSVEASSAVTPQPRPDAASTPEAMLAIGVPPGVAAEPSAAKIARPMSTDQSPSIASNDSKRTNVQSPVDPGPTSAGLLFVYDVRLTEMGRALRPVRSAMAEAGLGDAERFRVDQSAVDVARTVTRPEETFRVMVLRAPLTTLDRLFSTLATDRESVESIGLTMVSDSSVSRLVQSVSDQVVAAGSVGVELTDAQDAPPAELATWIGDRPFVPVAGGAAAIGGAAGSGAAGAAAEAQETVLVLIR